MLSVAVLGLGAMGSRMALNLVKAGFAVTVWNRDSTRAQAVGHAGARVAKSPREAAGDAEVVISMVTDDAAARIVWLDGETGAMAAMRAGSVAVECSTVSPAWIAELRLAAERRGAGLLDAPVAGSRPQAEAGQLIVMAGGPEEVLSRVQPVLSALAAKVLHVGPSGQGALLKLAVNTLFAAQIESVAEVLGFLGRAGLDRQAAAEWLATFPIVSPAIAGMARMIAAGQSTPLFTVDLITKDLAYTLEAAAAVGADMPGAVVAHAVFQQTRDMGLGDQNVSALGRRFA